jgi:hypothetical protein
LIEQDNSPEASLPTQTVEGGRQDVFGSGMVVDYNQVFEHARIVENAASGIVTSLSSMTKEPVSGFAKRDHLGRGIRNRERSGQRIADFRLPSLLTANRIQQSLIGNRFNPIATAPGSEFLGPTSCVESSFYHCGVVLYPGPANSERIVTGVSLINTESR